MSGRLGLAERRHEPGIIAAGGTGAVWSHSREPVRAPHLGGSLHGALHLLGPAEIRSSSRSRTSQTLRLHAAASAADSASLSSIFSVKSHG